MQESLTAFSFQSGCGFRVLEAVILESPSNPLSS